MFLYFAITLFLFTFIVGVSKQFSIENGLLTPTMKVKRNKVIIEYKNILENFYKR